MDDKQEHQPITTTPAAAHARGDALALLTPVVYQRLRRLGQIYMQRERRNHTLQPTALVNEALFKLAHAVEPEDGDKARHFNDQQHFYAVCARQMRHVLVDHARTRYRERRQYVDEMLIERDISGEPLTTGGLDFIELDQMLKLLEQVDPDCALALELYYFGGHTVPDIVKITNVSLTTVTRRLRLARAWMLKQLQPGAAATTERIDNES